MKMTVADLIEALQGMDQEAEVRIASGGYRTNLEYTLDDVVMVAGEEEPPEPHPDEYGDDAEGRRYFEEEYEQYERTMESRRPAVVYFAEGSQIGYLPSEARDELGW